MKYEVRIVKDETRQEESENCFVQTETIELKPEKQAIFAMCKPQYEFVRREFRCSEQFAVMIVDGEPYLLKQGERLIFTVEQKKEVSVVCMGEGKLFVSYFYFNEETVETAPESAQHTATAFFNSDLRLAYKIALTQFRGSKRIVPSLREVWYDRTLQRAIDRLEKASIPFFLLLIGLAVFAGLGMQNWGQKGALLLMGVWLIADLFFLNPLLFYAFLPKPIAPHIKRIDSLNDADRKLYEAELAENKKVEKIFKRYEVPGREKYKDYSRYSTAAAEKTEAEMQKNNENEREKETKNDIF